MEKAKEFLDRNCIDFEIVLLGDEEFNVTALHVPFYYDEIGNSREQRIALEKYAKQRKRTLACRSLPFGAGCTYEILPQKDADAIDAYRAQKNKEVEEFWFAEHERRKQKAGAVSERSNKSAN